MLIFLNIIVKTPFNVHNYITIKLRGNNHDGDAVTMKKKLQHARNFQKNYSCKFEHHRRQYSFTAPSAECGWRYNGWVCTRLGEYNNM